MKVPAVKVPAPPFQPNLIDVAVLALNQHPATGQESSWEVLELVTTETCPVIPFAFVESWVLANIIFSDPV